MTFYSVFCHNIFKLFGYLMAWKTPTNKIPGILNVFLPSAHRKYSPDLHIHGWTVGETNDERRPDAIKPGKENETEREIL